MKSPLWTRTWDAKKEEWRGPMKLTVILPEREEEEEVDEEEEEEEEDDDGDDDNDAVAD